jgi:alpha-L-fucosidase 2
MQQNVLRYTEPACSRQFAADSDGAWNEATPIGNGSMGAMIYGGVRKETLQLNEDTVWYGCGGRNRVNPEAKANYLKVRRLLQDGMLDRAQRLAEDTMMPAPDQQRNYSTAGEIHFEFHDEGDVFCNYRRQLDLTRAVVGLEYEIGGRKYRREYFASAVHHVIAVHQEALDNGTAGGCLSLAFFRSAAEKVETLSGRIICLTAKEGADGCRYCILAAVKTDGGTVRIHRDRIRIEGAHSFTVYLSVRSDFYTKDPAAWGREKLETVLNLPYETVKEAHIHDYQAYFNRVRFSLGTEDSAREQLSVPDRLQALQNGATDLGLIADYFQFGRYLLISCSRPGTQPANLQGIWNRSDHPAWGSKYTININTEMNYWPTESCNLSECHAPLFDLLRRMLPNGKKVAQDMYGLPGFVAHHNTDLFGDCAPQDAVISSTLWPMGAAWLCMHIWYHYEYTLDTGFLRENIDLLKEAGAFLADYLFENEHGYLVTGPSVSPENTFIQPDGESGSLCTGPAMDTEITRDLFRACIAGAEITGCEDVLTERLKKLLPRLQPPSVGKYGQIMEWAEDYEEKEPGHRHISQLYALYPSDQISSAGTPELVKAARVTLERRLKNGGGHTGWSRAWIICMWARLHDGNKAGEHITALLADSTYPNLFDRHPPFQIDGNFGGTAAIAEMLLQSQNGMLTFLPALPDSWDRGSISGLKAKGAMTVSFEWEDRQVCSGSITVEKGGVCCFLKPDGIGHITAVPRVSLTTQGQKIICEGTLPYKIRLSKISAADGGEGGSTFSGSCF